MNELIIKQAIAAGQMFPDKSIDEVFEILVLAVLKTDKINILELCNK